MSVAGIQLNGHFYKSHGILQGSLTAVTERSGHPAKTIARVWRQQAICNNRWRNYCAFQNKRPIFVIVIIDLNKQRKDNVYYNICLTFRGSCFELTLVWLWTTLKQNENVCSSNVTHFYSIQNCDLIFFFNNNKKL